jgi:rhodanese-related sulfurtransferase
MSFFKSLFGSPSTQGENVKVLSPSEFKTGLNQKNILLIDVRTQVEYKSGHIKKSINVDFFQQGKFKSTIESLDKSKDVYVYCRSGQRSRKAAKMIADMGFSNVFDLQGGYLAWN